MLARLVWRQLISGELEMHTGPGDSSGPMLEAPHVEVLAQALQERIDKD